MQTLNVGKCAITSPSLPGNAMTKKAFVKWIRAAERGPSISLQEAKANWLSKKKELLKFAK